MIEPQALAWAGALGAFALELSLSACVAAAALAVALRLARNAAPRGRHALVLGAMGATLTAPFVARVARALAAPAGMILPSPGPELALPVTVAGASSGAGASSAWDQALVLLGAAWALGALFALGRGARAWLAARRLTRRGTRPARASLVGCVDVLRRDLGVRRAVRVLESTLAEVPAVIGWLAPVVLVPAGIAAGLPPAELRALLAHELAHVLRGDYLVALLTVLFEALLFFHPAAWWMSRRLAEERECSCDDLAAAACGGPLTVARALAALEERRARGGELTLGSDGGPLMRRILRLTRPREGACAGFAPLATALVALPIALAAVLFATSEAEAAQGRGSAPDAGHFAGAVMGPTGGAVAGPIAGAPSAQEPRRRAVEIRRLEQEIRALDERIAALRDAIAQLESAGASGYFDARGGSGLGRDVPGPRRTERRARAEERREEAQWERGERRERVRRGRVERRDRAPEAPSGPTGARRRTAPESAPLLPGARRRVAPAPDPSGGGASGLRGRGTAPGASGGGGGIAPRASGGGGRGTAPGASGGGGRIAPRAPEEGGTVPRASGVRGRRAPAPSGAGGRGRRLPAETDAPRLPEPGVTGPSRGGRLRLPDAGERSVPAPDAPQLPRRSRASGPGPEPRSVPAPAPPASRGYLRRRGGTGPAGEPAPDPPRLPGAAPATEPAPPIGAEPAPDTQPEPAPRPSGPRARGSSWDDVIGLGGGAGGRVGGGSQADR